MPQADSVSRREGVLSSKLIMRHTGLVYVSRVESELASKSPTQTPAGTLSETAITSLRSAIELEGQNAEDVFQARATLGLALLSLDQKEQSLAILSTSLPSALSSESSDGRQRLQGWTYVSVAKAAYVRGKCLKRKDCATTHR